MPALTFVEFNKVGDSPSVYESEVAGVTSGNRAWVIPLDAGDTIFCAVFVNTAAEYKAEYSYSSGARLNAGTYRPKDVFGENQTTDQDFELPRGPSALIITLVSGSIDVEVRIV
jgi:hypothetical protein